MGMRWRFVLLVLVYFARAGFQGGWVLVKKDEKLDQGGYGMSLGLGSELWSLEQKKRNVRPGRGVCGKDGGGPAAGQGFFLSFDLWVVEIRRMLVAKTVKRYGKIRYGNTALQVAEAYSGWLQREILGPCGYEREF
jgi:hypothetical protein